MNNTRVEYRDMYTYIYSVLSMDNTRIKYGDLYIYIFIAY